MESTGRYLRAWPVVPLVLAAALIGRPAAGQEIDAKGDRELAAAGHKIDTAAARAAPERVVDRIVGEFSGKTFTFQPGGPPRALTAAEVQALRQQGLGFGEISILLALAPSGSNPNDILAMRKPGEGWGRLARDLGYRNLGSVIKEVKATGKGVARVALERTEKREGVERPANAERPGRPERSGMPERMERPERPMRPERPGR